MSRWLASYAREIEDLGLEVAVLDPLMVDAAASRRVALAALELAERLR